MRDDADGDDDDADDGDDGFIIIFIFLYIRSCLFIDLRTVDSINEWCIIILST